MLGENQNESSLGGAEEDPNGTPRSEKGSQEVDRSIDQSIDRPDLELNYQGNSLVIDMSRSEWIALAIIVLSVASTIYLLR